MEVALMRLAVYLRKTLGQCLKKILLHTVGDVQFWRARQVLVRLTIRMLTRYSFAITKEVRHLVSFLVTLISYILVDHYVKMY